MHSTRVGWKSWQPRLKDWKKKRSYNRKEMNEKLKKNGSGVSKPLRTSTPACQYGSSSCRLPCIQATPCLEKEKKSLLFLGGRRNRFRLSWGRNLVGGQLFAKIKGKATFGEVKLYMWGRVGRLWTCRRIRPNKMFFPGTGHVVEWNLESECRRIGGVPLQRGGRIVKMQEAPMRNEPMLPLGWQCSQRPLEGFQMGPAQNIQLHNVATV